MNEMSGTGSAYVNSMCQRPNEHSRNRQQKDHHRFRPLSRNQKRQSPMKSLVNKHHPYSGVVDDTWVQAYRLLQSIFFPQTAQESEASVATPSPPPTRAVPPPTSATVQQGSMPTATAKRPPAPAASPETVEEEGDP